MLNAREVKMLNDFYDHQSQSLTSNFFVEKYQVSTRTIQSDIKKIKQSLNGSKSAELISKPSIGSKLKIINDKKFQKSFLNNSVHLKTNEPERIQKLFRLLLNQTSPLSKVKIAEKLYVSNSTLTNDLNKLSVILEQDNLKISRKSHGGIKIVGAELNIRKCLLKFGIYSSRSNNQEEDNTRKEIEKILVNILIKHHCNISDNLFQNLIVHIEVSIKRIQSGFSLKDVKQKVVPEFQEGYQIANEIFDALEKRFYFKATTGEILNLAIYLQGKSDYVNFDYVSKSVNQFIMQSLVEIRDKFKVDFTQEINLRISLALHIMPLITRVEYDIQNDNVMLDNIRESFPLAFDMAAYMGLLLQNKIGKKIKESEIAYLAIYFNQYLNRNNHFTGFKNLLIITNLKRSENVLLRERFITWFDKEISSISIVNITEVPEIDVNKYDVVFTTNQTRLTDKLGAILISDFPNNEEYPKIKLAIDGFRTKEDLLNLFSKDRFEFKDLDNKDEALNEIISISKNAVGKQKKNLDKAVRLREQLGSSFFSNTIAFPHPISPISVSTFVSILLLKKPIQWDEDNNKVDLIILVSIEKNNVKAFELWSYLSKIIQNKEFVKKLKKKPTFENFIAMFSEILD